MEKIQANSFDIVFLYENIRTMSCLFTHVLLYFLHLVLTFTPYYIIMVKVYYLCFYLYCTHTHTHTHTQAPPPSVPRVPPSTLPLPLPASCSREWWTRRERGPSGSSGESWSTPSTSAHTSSLTRYTCRRTF